eukprot:TRINITY_DN44832_c0_g1_i1.p1 TRINITY_DN44832_c0_g1~~TRINITY_DN44832_c0_g1_i1.p1  ORF type:complete len:179 (-),score=10.59 TRINITY_DN44832_c0_g1_i1:317-817(-)
MNPALNSTFTFLKYFFEEIAEVFPDQYIHTGGDEVSFSCWASNPGVAKFVADNNWDYSQLEQYYQNTLLTIVGNLGKDYVVWEDVFDNGVTLLPSTVIEIWKGGWESTIAATTAAGYRSILSSPWYLNYISYGEDWPTYYAVDPWAFSGSAAQKKTCLWRRMLLLG